MTCTGCGWSVADADRFCAGCGRPLTAGPQRETRRKVSALFLDLVDSTVMAERLDPEPLRRVMDRWFAGCVDAVAEHGGAVEKFIGDAVLAVFGATEAHEDDALRAVRAGVGALTALAELTAELRAEYQVAPEARAGVCTGDVVVLTRAGEDFRVIGDAVNTAARLQTAARPGEVLVCADTAVMVRGQVGLAPVAPLSLKGKARPVPAWRVGGSEPTAGPSAPSVPFIGREGELSVLEDGLRKARRRRRVQLVTVVGAPGIGKSRLVREFLAGLPADEVAVLTGRCSAYGRGITFRPLAEMVGALPGGLPALARAGAPDGPSEARRAAQVLDLVEKGGCTGLVGVEDITWATGRLLEVLGRSRAVVMLWDDLHRSEPSLLDLIEELAVRLRDTPVLLLCLARPSLLERRVGWGEGREDTTVLELGPMTESQTTELLGHLALREEVQAHQLPVDSGRVATLCDGNPLFAEQLMDVLAEGAPGARVPVGIQALLGARLDQLSENERRSVELAAVIGREFGRAPLVLMAEAEALAAPALDEATARLVRRRILEPGPGGSLRFAQELMRDTAYEFTPKARRERRHELLAQWFAEQPEPDPLVVAHHVEAAHRLRRQLRPGDTGLPALASTAADTLTGQGRHALARRDLPAAVQLLSRARDLLSTGDHRHTALALRLCDAGIALRDAELCSTALARAAATGPDDPAAAAVLAIQRGIVELRLGLAPSSAVEPALDPGDHLGWCRLHQLRCHRHLLAERTGAAEAELRLALERARAMADDDEEDRLLGAAGELARRSPTAVAAGLALCAELGERFADGWALLVPVLLTRAHLTALGGDIDAARRILGDLLSSARENRSDPGDAAVLAAAGYVESLAGAHPVAEARYRQSLAARYAGPHAPDVRDAEVAIARALFDQGRIAEAAASLPEDGAAPLRALIGAAALRGRIASALGRHQEALAAADAARVLATGADDPCLVGGVLFDLAVVRRAAGRAQPARDAGTAAVRAFEAKGAVLPADRVRAWLGTLGGPDV
ncbi:AAA family ATPase [Kitasatospora sp. NPDC004289]